MVRGARGGPCRRAGRPLRIRRRRRACGGGVAVGVAGDESRTATSTSSGQRMLWYRSVMRGDTLVTACVVRRLLLRALGGLAQ